MATRFVPARVPHALRAAVAGALLLATVVPTASAQPIAEETAMQDQRRQRVAAFFDHLRRKDLDGWAALWAPDAVIQVPYPPEGFERRIEGRDAILAAFRDLFAHFERFDARISAVYPADDSAAVCVEYKVDASLRDGTAYSNDNIAVFRFDGDRIVAYHDYFDPRRFQVVVDAVRRAQAAP